MLSWENFKITWNSICIIATISAVIWQLCTYIYGEDITVVHFSQFHGNEFDVYPSIGVCLTMALNNQALER